MKAVIYARYSSDNQREESIDGQLRECTAYCNKNNITILRSYIDRALSAKTDNRPDFQRMIKDSAKGLFDVVIVWKLDRFARNRYDSAHYKAQLRKYGVRVLSATENISDGPEGIILESMLEGMAEYYSAELSEKVIRGHTENALKCKYNGGTPTFGYFIDKDKQYQIDPRTAPVVLDIFTQYDKGATMKEIRDFLNAAGVTTVRGKPIDLNFVSHILHNRKFIGEYSYRDIVVPNGIPALVPQDLFDRVQEQMVKNKKAPARHKAEDDYLLTTKLFCGTCKAMMIGECGTSASQGRKYHYYRCVNTKKHKTCNSKHKSIRKLPIENAVVNAVMEKIMDDNFVAYITNTVMEIQTRESSALPALRKQLEEVERGITNILNAIQAGIFTTSTKQRLDELEDRKTDIELQIVREEMRHPLLSREDVTYWICRFRSLDVNKKEERRRLIDSFVNSVTVFDDHIIITFNYKEGTTTVPFSKLDSSDLSSVGGPKNPVTTFVATGFFVFWVLIFIAGGTNMLTRIKSFIEKETVLCIAAGCAILTMFIIPPDQKYLHYIDFRVLCLLFCLMAVVAGLKTIGLFHWLTYQLLRRICSGRILSVTLVLLPFFSSMFVTNDVALIIFIPFTLMLLDQLGQNRSIIPIMVFQTIAANLGSMATPVGNPQNLYLYAFYNMSIGDFFSVTLPLTAVSLLALSVAAISLLPRKLPKQTLEKAEIRGVKQLLIYLALFSLCLLTVFKIVPYPLTTAITVAVLLLTERKLLKEIDYMLLLTFVCFFTVSENLGRVDVIRSFLQQLLQWSTLLTAVGTSQVISNVPAAIVLSGFTDQWREMLAGVNIGGLGTPIASLASLITMKFYMRWPNANIMRFLGYFTVANIISLVILLLFTQII